MTRQLNYYITALAICINFIGLGQGALLDSCHKEIGNNLFCGSQILVFKDSTFIRTEGCERHQSIQIGKLLEFTNDTIFLKRCQLSFECIYDRVEFIQGEGESVDTIDIFYFDSNGESTYSEHDMITHYDTAVHWANAEPKYNYYFVPHIEDCVGYSRSYEYFNKHNKSIPKEHPFHDVTFTYLNSASVELGFLLADFSVWTDIRKVLKIPPNTQRINVYYALPKSIIPLLQIYGVKLDHVENPIIYNCGSKIYRID